MTMSRYGDAAIRVARDCFIRMKNPNAIPMVYFTDRANVGDLLNEYLVPRVSGREIVKVRSSLGSHLRAVGSVVGSASRSSYIWGGGSIDGARPSRELDAKKICALRGEKTREMLACHYGGNLASVPLGDPAILMPEYFCPKVESEGVVGIIPHFSDADIVRDAVLDKNHVKVISVEQNPEPFIEDLLKCDYVFSSSLHGLILADAYGVSNRWIKLSDRLLGGSFKFIDYYTTVDAGSDAPLIVSSDRELLRLLDNPERHCEVSHYRHNKRELLDSFPNRYRDDNNA